MEPIKKYIKHQLTPKFSETTEGTQKQLQDTALAGPEAICCDSSGKEDGLTEALRELAQIK